MTRDVLKNATRDMTAEWLGPEAADAIETAWRRYLAAKRAIAAEPENPKQREADTKAEEAAWCAFKLLSGDPLSRLPWDEATKDAFYRWQEAKGAARIRAFHRARQRPAIKRDAK